MDRITFLNSVFCLIEDWLTDRHVRQRGPAPLLEDIEVLTLEAAGAFFGIQTDEGGRRSLPADLSQPLPPPSTRRPHHVRCAPLLPCQAMVSPPTTA